MATPALGKEYLEKDEEENTQALVDMLKAEMVKRYAPGETKRDFHPKMHGLLKATFTVEENLPEKYAQGLFKTPKTYDAWIRYSNAPTSIKPDKDGQGRGMGIKVMGVEGENLIDDQSMEGSVQDFLLITPPILTAATVKGYRSSLNAIQKPFPNFLFVLLNPTKWRLIYLTLKNQKKCPNLLEFPFFSASPYRYGPDESVAVQFKVSPHKPATSTMPKKPSDYFLRERLIEDLKDNSFSFDFMVGFQEDPTKQKIEDTSYEWKVPYTKVATITIPKQDFNYEAQLQFAENLTFSPWHCLPDHRPIGGINRCRKAIYNLMQEFRLKRNRVKEEMEA